MFNNSTEIDPFFIEEPEHAFLDFKVEPGQMDFRVVNQDEWWINIKSQPILLSTMSTDYLANVYGMLQSKAAELHAWAVQQTINNILIDLQNGIDNTDVLQYQLTGTTIANMSHEEWLDSTPLVRKIQQLINK